MLVFGTGREFLSSHFVGLFVTVSLCRLVERDIREGSELDDGAASHSAVTRAHPQLTLASPRLTSRSTLKTKGAFVYDVDYPV
jgi:hypothetical protein